jgi:integrase
VKHTLFGGGFKKKSEAEEAEREAIEQLKHPVRPPVPIFGEWFHGRFWTEWVLGGPRGANSPSEQENKRSIYRVHLADFFGSLPLDRIDEQLVNTFRARLRGLLNEDGTRQLSEKRINNILGVLSKPLKYAERVNIITRAPHVGVAKVERPEIEFLEFDEVGALIRSAAEDDEPEYEIAVELVYGHGLRIGEAKALDYLRIDMRGRSFVIDRQVRPVKDAGGKYVETFGPPKGKRRRTVPMSPRLHELLRDRLPRGFVLPGKAAGWAQDDVGGALGYGAHREARRPGR